MHIQNNDVTPATSQIYIWNPFTNKFYSLNCWHYSVVYKKSCSQLMNSVSFSVLKKNYNPLLLPCPLFYLLTSCTPTKSNLHLANLPDYCRNWTCPVQIPNIPGTKSHVPLTFLMSYESISLGLRHVFMFRNKLRFTARSCQHLAQPPSWRTTPCRHSCSTYSKYLQLPSILEAVAPSATWGHAMPWWQGPTYHGLTFDC